MSSVTLPEYLMQNAGMSYGYARVSTDAQDQRGHPRAAPAQEAGGAKLGHLRLDALAVRRIPSFLAGSIA